MQALRKDQLLSFLKRFTTLFYSLYHKLNKLFHCFSFNFPFAASKDQLVGLRKNCNSKNAHLSNENSARRFNSCILFFQIALKVNITIMFMYSLNALRKV